MTRASALMHATGAIQFEADRVAQLGRILGAARWSAFWLDESDGAVIYDGDRRLPGLTIIGTTTNLRTLGARRLLFDGAGNRVARVIGNAAVDAVMRYDTLAGTAYPIAFAAFGVSRPSPIASAERFYQYGDQGSAVGDDGGHNCRINTDGTLSLALHPPYPNGSTKAVSITSAASALNTARHFVVGLDASGYLSPWGGYIYADGKIDNEAAAASDAVIPGVSDSGATRQGFALFSQADAVGTNPLKSATVYGPIVFGRCRSRPDLSAIAAGLYRITVY